MGYFAVITHDDGTAAQYAHLLPFLGDEDSETVIDESLMSWAKAPMLVIAEQIREQEAQYASVFALARGETTRVEKGDIIGFMGSTGKSYGFHLHFAMASKLPSNYWNDENTLNRSRFYQAITTFLTATGMHQHRSRQQYEEESARVI